MCYDKIMTDNRYLKDILVTILGGILVYEFLGVRGLDAVIQGLLVGVFLLIPMAEALDNRFNGWDD